MLALFVVVFQVWVRQGKEDEDESVHAAWHVVTSTILALSMNFAIDYDAIYDEEFGGGCQSTRNHAIVRECEMKVDQLI